MDLCVIGAGPGGYVAAIKAAQLGLKVCIIDKNASLGGTCLNIGCIPSKALLDASHHYAMLKDELKHQGIVCENPSIDLPTMMNHKTQVVTALTKGVDYLMKKNNIQKITGTAKINGPNSVSITKEDGSEEVIETKNILIATGSIPNTLPGVDIDEQDIVTSTGALSFDAIPKHLVVVGGGYIGLELGSVWLRLGAKVTVVEASDHFLRMLDHEVGSALEQSLKKQGMTILLNHKLKTITKGNEFTLILDHDGEEVSLTADKVLISAGRKPYVAGLGLENVSIEVNERGFVPVNDHFQTSCPSIYAIGDVIGGAMLAHKAEDEGLAAAQIIAGKTGHVNYGIIPSIIYTAPQVASVGKTEETLKEEGIPYRVGKFPFSANGRAKAAGDKEGFVKILTHEKTDRILGAHIIGQTAEHLIQEVVMAMELGGSAEDLARTCHAHPTYSEAVKEAAFAAFDKPLQF